MLSEKKLEEKAGREKFAIKFKNQSSRDNVLVNLIEQLQI